MSLNILYKNKTLKVENFEIYWKLGKYNLELTIKVYNKLLMDVISLETFLSNPKEWKHILENDYTKCIYIWDLRRIIKKLYNKNFENLNNKLRIISLKT